MKILEIDQERRRLSLSVKRVEDQILPSELRAAAGEAVPVASFEDEPAPDIDEADYVAPIVVEPAAEVEVEASVVDEALEAEEPVAEVEAPAVDEAPEAEEPVAEVEAPAVDEAPEVEEPVAEGRGAGRRRGPRGRGAPCRGGSRGRPCARGRGRGRGARGRGRARRRDVLGGRGCRAASPSSA